MSKKPRAQPTAPRQITLEQWLQHPDMPVKRGELPQVLQIALQRHDAWRRWNRWHQRAARWAIRRSGIARFARWYQARLRAQQAPAVPTQPTPAEQVPA